MNIYDFLKKKELGQLRSYSPTVAQPKNFIISSQDYERNEL
jgi:hypothetical protein